MTTPAQGADELAAPLVESSLEPGSPHWTESDAEVVDAEIVDAEVVDAEVVGEDGRIYAPRSGSHDADHKSDAAEGAAAACDSDVLAALDAELDGALDANGEPSRLAALTWSCKCGEVVSFAETACPVCGSSFLGDLHDGVGGRHRPGGAALSWLPESRQVRLAMSAFIAIAFAVLLPVIISVFG
ncbi:MAG TPA: hypothetical protein VHX15_08115 [Frankiaceae bacterium]|nr:hypothetical protein [Frankiaceae bacterium]